MGTEAAILIASAVVGGLAAWAWFVLAAAAERSEDPAREIFYTWLSGVCLFVGVCALVTGLFVAFR
jgi:hypothetical protein